MNELVKKQLYQFMIQKNVDPSTAEIAANNCAVAIYRNGVFGSVGLSAALVTLSKNPFAMVGAVPFGALAGGVLTLGFSSSCDDVRTAAERWVSN